MNWNIFSDESGIELSICKDRIWSKGCERPLRKSRKYYEKTNIIAFETLLEKFLIKELKP